MKERPILFSAPMVRALLDGSKTQTRRVVKPQPEWVEPATIWQQGDGHSGPGWYAHNEDYSDEGALFYRSPYGQPGDRLWVKETTIKVEDHGYEGPVFTESDDGRTVIEYGLAPSEDDCTEVEPEDIKLRPSIFMPRAMSRITLEITAVRVERLQDISRGDAMGEGCPFPNMAQGDDPRQWYADLWGQINGLGSWDQNPWVWVIEFKRVQP